MGLLLWFIGKLVWPAIITSGATYTAFRLGPQLPVAARRAGQWIGMRYNYLKCTIVFFMPEPEYTNKIVSEYRKGS